MNTFVKKKSIQLLAKLMLIIMLTTVMLPLTSSLFPGNEGKVFAAEPFDSLAVKAVRNNYALHQGGRAVDGGWGNFGAYDAYILTQAGADVSTWVYNGTSLKAGVLSLIDATIANEGAGSQSSAKRVAQEYLAAKAFGDARAAQLLDILKNRQSASGNGSFDNNAFSDLPAFEALGRAGDAAEIDAATAITYILGNQDSNTGAWTSTWNDFQATAQAVRALESLKPLAGGQAGAVQTAIDNGKTWLQGRQQADGSFRDAGGFDDPLVDTAEAIFTLNYLGIDPAAWNVGGKSAVDYMRDNALNNDGTFGTSKNLVNNTWALDAYRVLGGSVAPATVLGVKVTPDTASILVGGTRQYTAQAYKMDGTEEDVSATATWTVDDTSIATVDAGGLVTGVGAGDAVITATYQGVSDTAQVTVEGGGGAGGGNPPPQGTPVSVKVTGRSGETLFSQTTVYLSNGDTHGITALGALHKTGLSYSYDSIDYIHTIAGQGPQGMNGWMYKVNGTVPGISAIQYNLNANDRVWWFYSTDPDNIASVNGGSVITPLNVDKTGDELITEALEKAQEIRISLENREGNTVEISPDKIKELYDKNKEMTLNNKGVELTFAPNCLYTDQLSKALGEEKAVLKIGVKVVTASEKQEILDKAKIGQSNGLFEIGGIMVELTAQITRTDTAGTTATEKIASFNEPVKVTIDLSNVTLKDEEISKLTAVRYEKDAAGNILPVKLGGEYDPVTKLFTFYTDEFSYYGVVKSEDLVTISMGINMLTTTVNGKRGYTDVPPALINNRTMVPLRFVAESFGADVQWVESERMVEMRLGGKSLKLAPATIVHGRTLVPLRYISESFGAKVTWFPSSKKVEIVL